MSGRLEEGGVTSGRIHQICERKAVFELPRRLRRLAFETDCTDVHYSGGDLPSEMDAG